MINPIGDIPSNNSPSSSSHIATASGGSWGGWWDVYEIIPKDREIQIEMILYMERQERKVTKSISQNQVGFRIVMV
mgnify:CR=1 FL=1